MCPGISLAFDLVTGGQAAVRLVVPDGEHPVTMQAGELLARYVKEITGSELPIIAEKEAGKEQGGRRVFLGATRAALAAGVDVSKLKYDGFIWKVVKGDLYIAGQDFTFASAKDSLRLVNACHGTVRGIYRLLEEYGGVRWFLPTPKGVVIPKADRFSVPDQLDHKEEPPFGYTLGGLAGLGEWSLANGQRRAVDVLVKGHSWDGALRGRGDPEKLFEKEPERFALVNGKRYHSKSGFQLCTSHPDFVDMNVEYFSKLFDAGYQWVEYNQSDGWIRCDCERCNAMDMLDEIEKKTGNYWSREPDPCDLTRAPAERLWVPLHAIAERLYVKYPDRKIVVLAYHPTVIPSKKIKQFPPNVMISLTREYPAYFEQFAGFDKTIWTYWWGDYHAAGVTPNMMAHKVAEHLRPLADHGIMGIYSCGGGGTWGLAGSAYYVYTKLAWNPNLDVDAVLDDYCRGVYHAAGPEMKEFFNLIEARVETGKAKQTVEQRAANAYNIAVDNYFAEAYPPIVLNSMDILLAKAKAKIANDNTALQWLALTELQYRYLKTIANGFTLYREYRYSRNKTPALCRELIGAIKAREDLISEIKGLKDKADWLKDWFPGVNGYMTSMQTGGSIYARLLHRPPFSEAFAKELAKRLK